MMSFLYATELLSKLKNGEVSPTELLSLQTTRADALHHTLNAVPIRDDTRAWEQATTLEHTPFKERPPLAGLAITIKDHIDVAGLHSPCGAPDGDLEPAPADAPVVARLRAAGAIIYGKTNMPRYGVDWQTDNALYGRTSNPWDVTRTPGGSSGGAAAAVAAGLTSLEVGSDTGGSIRIPAAYCGVYGHRPSNSLLPRIGTAPGSRKVSSPARVFGVQGPLARSAADLKLALDIMMGPGPLEHAWRVQLPKARFDRLERARVAFLQPFPWCRLADDVRQALEHLYKTLEASGVRVSWVSSEVIGAGRDRYALYLSIMAAQTSSGVTLEVLQALHDGVARTGAWFDQAWLAGTEASAAELMRWLTAREHQRLAWRDFFTEWDVLVTPVTLRTAFPHDPTLGPDWFATFDVDGQAERYIHHFAYPALATLSGLPATAFPCGLSDEGLPIGLQAIGPYLEDYTPLAFSHMVSEISVGYKQPSRLRPTH